MIGAILSSGLDGDYSIMAEEARRRFMRHTGLNCVVVHTGNHKNYGVKLEMHSFFGERQTVVMFDADLWFVRDVDLSIYDNREEFLAALDPGRLDSSGFHFPWVDCQSLSIDPNLYFNTGMMIFNSRHREVFRDAKRLMSAIKLKDFGEQSYINGAVQMKGVPFKALSPSMNFIPFAVREKLDMPNIDHPNVVHAAGYGGDEKLRSLRVYAEMYSNPRMKLLGSQLPSEG